MAKTLPSKAGGVGSIPGQGAKIQHASWPKDRDNIVKNSVKTLKMVHIKKKFLNTSLKLPDYEACDFFLNRDEDGL